MSQKHFFLELHYPKKTNEILDKILPYEARAKFCQIHISFIFGAMEFQEKLLLGFTDLYHVFSSRESMYLDHLYEA